MHTYQFVRLRDDGSGCLVRSTCLRAGAAIIGMNGLYEANRRRKPEFQESLAKGPLELLRFALHGNVRD